LAAADVESMKVVPGGGRIRPEGLYVRLSGATGQGSLLAAQEVELCATSVGEVPRVFGDLGSGLREDRPGLSGLLDAGRRVGHGGFARRCSRPANKAEDSRCPLQ
jgi:putative resolvase